MPYCGRSSFLLTTLEALRKQTESRQTTKQDQHHAARSRVSRLPLGDPSAIGNHWDFGVSGFRHRHHRRFAPPWPMRRTDCSMSSTVPDAWPSCSKQAGVHPTDLLQRAQSRAGTTVGPRRPWPITTANCGNANRLEVNKAWRASRPRRELRRNRGGARQPALRVAARLGGGNPSHSSGRLRAACAAAGFRSVVRQPPQISAGLCPAECRAETAQLK